MPDSIQPMDDELRDAAIYKNDDSALDFLREALQSKPKEYFTSLHMSGNIFHIAAFHNNLSFFDAALKVLSRDSIHSLLCQQVERRRGVMNTIQSLLLQKSITKVFFHVMNPIHLAAYRGCDVILRLLIKYYEKNVTTLGLEPWLAQDGEGRTPLHYVLEDGSQNQALQILSLVEVESISNIEDEQGDSPLFLAVKKGLSRVANKIMNSRVSPPYSLSGRFGQNAIFFAPECSDDVCSQLIRRHFKLIVGKGEYNLETVLHIWASIAKMCPLKLVMEDDFIPPNLRIKFIDQLLAKDVAGANPLHNVARSNYDKAKAVEVAKFLIESYKRERAEALSTHPKESLPWFMKNRQGMTPLGLAIRNENEELALYILRLDIVYSVSENDEDDLLYWAVRMGCSTVVKEILDLVDQYRLSHLLTGRNGETVLHVVPNCTEHIFKRMLENYPELINETNIHGDTIIHQWLRIGKKWPFEYILKEEFVKSGWRQSFISLLSREGSKKMKPLHLAANGCDSDGDGSDHEDEGVVEQIVGLLLHAWEQAYQDDNHKLQTAWSGKDKDGYTPLSRAVGRRSEKVVLCLLSRPSLFSTLESGEVGVTLIQAAEYGWQRVVKCILDQVHSNRPNEMDCLRSHEKNILHVGWKCTEENCELIVQRWPKLAIEHDAAGKRPLERASEVGAAHVVELILQKDRSSILESPLAWIEACQNHHISTLRAFAKSPYFRNLCRKNSDSPLHHLPDLSFAEYQDLLKDPSIKELRNLQNANGETPLHIAIKRDNKDLVELLLTMDDVDWDLKDDDDQTAIQLLHDKCRMDDDWRRMCQVTIAFDPKSKTPYIRMKTGLDDIVSLVAALLATITFTAGFTVPGGFNNDNGEVILAKKAAFLVFLISDAFAMCCSMLILLSITWSMIWDRTKSSLLIDRSLVLLGYSLYGTLLAFMSGVYAITHHKALWAAIVVIAMCSVIFTSADKNLLCFVLRIIPASRNESMLTQLQGRWNRARQDQASSNVPNPLQQTTPTEAEDENVSSV